MELINSQISELFSKFPPQEVVLTLAQKQCPKLVESTIKYIKELS